MNKNDDEVLNLGGEGVMDEPEIEPEYPRMIFSKLDVPTEYQKRIIDAGRAITQYKDCKPDKSLTDSQLNNAIKTLEALEVFAREQKMELLRYYVIMQLNSFQSIKFHRDWDKRRN